MFLLSGAYAANRSDTVGLPSAAWLLADSAGWPNVGSMMTDAAQLSSAVELSSPCEVFGS